MPTETVFDRDSIARWYAKQHRKTDPAISGIYYLPGNAPEREIRFVEVNTMIAELTGELEPVDFGVDRGTPNEHLLCILDVTPSQWDRINAATLPLPAGWSLQSAVPV